MISEFDRDRAALDVLLKQYEFLREEITRCIYLEHIAILGLYTFLGLVIASLIKEDALDPISNFDITKHLFFLFLLVFAQVIICGFGSLFLKEQARNRRACSFLRALEYIISEKIGEIGIYWENFIVSPLIDKKINMLEHLMFEIPVNPQYYKNRLLGVGIPIYLSNFLITSVLAFLFCNLYDKDSNAFMLFLSIYVVVLLLGVIVPIRSTKYPGAATIAASPIAALTGTIVTIVFVLHLTSEAIDVNLRAFFLLFFISTLITCFWASMIIHEIFLPLKKEVAPTRERILDWFEKEQSKILFGSMPSIFTIQCKEVGVEVELCIHIAKKKYSGIIYDVEISPEDQDPPWESVQCVGSHGSPTGWKCRKEGKGVKFLTRSDPLRKCEPVKFKFNVILPHKSIKSIRVHLTDKNDENISEIISKLSISTFTIKDEIVEMEVHEVRDEFSGKIFFIEIFPEDQDPPWESIECVANNRSLGNWECKKTKNGVRFLTESSPLKECKSTTFKFKIHSEKLPSYIRLHLKDQNKNLIGEVISIPRKNPP